MRNWWCLNHDPRDIEIEVLGSSFVVGDGDGGCGCVGGLSVPIEGVDGENAVTRCSGIV